MTFHSTGVRKKRTTGKNYSGTRPPFKGWMKRLFASKKNADPVYDKDKVVHSKTYDDTNITAAPPGRDFTETEYTMELRCYDKTTNALIEDPPWLYDLLNANDRAGANALAQLSTNAAYITNPSDETEYNQLAWDPASHSYRTQNPYVWLAVAGEDIPPGSTNATPIDDRVIIGFDLFDDYYFDTDNYDLLERDYTIRARMRRRVDLTRNPRVQRLLIQVKQGAIVNDEGLKEVHKCEDRIDRTQGDFPDAMLDELLDDTKK